MRTPRTASPFGLIQEELRDQPWRLLVACVMLNMTSIGQVRPVIRQFFLLYPTACDAAAAEHASLAELLRPLGLHNRRARSLIALSNAFDGCWNDVIELPGVGRYAADSYKIFVQGSIDVEPTDKKLQKYIIWAREQTIRTHHPQLER